MKFLLINGGQAFAHSGGELNKLMHSIAKETLTSLGHVVVESVVADGYNPADEANKFVDADVIIFQTPGWWMGLPWSVKKYIDEVYTAGYGKMYESDGRHRVDPTRNYGKGGLLQGRHSMLSLTWNAPIEAFTLPEEFFEGQGVDAVYFPFLKGQEFVGLHNLPTFMVNDVMKNPDIEAYRAAYIKHLKDLYAPEAIANGSLKRGIQKRAPVESAPVVEETTVTTYC